MSDLSEEQPSVRKEPVSGFSATPGCLIMICGLLTVVGFLVWSGYTLVKQSGEIDTFTAEAPVTIVPVEPSVDDSNALTAKLEQFQSAVAKKQPAELTLNAGELNILLSFEPFSEVNQLIRIDKIEPDAIHAQISFTLNALPPGTVRYLNGNLLFEPAVNSEIGLVLNTTNILVPEKAVAEGFLRRFKQDGYLDTMLVEEFRDDDKNPSLADALMSINAAEIRNDTVVVSYQPGSPKE